MEKIKKEIKEKMGNDGMKKVVKINGKEFYVWDRYGFRWDYKKHLKKLDDVKNYEVGDEDGYTTSIVGLPDSDTLDFYFKRLA